MQKISHLFLTSLFCAGVATLAVSAQNMSQGQNMPQGQTMMPRPIDRMFDPSTVETVEGTIQEIREVGPQGRPLPGTHVILDVDGEEMEAHLGPRWFFAQKGVAFKEGDMLKVKGSKVELMGKPAVIASEVEIEGNTIQLRDPQTGVPMWRGWQRGSMPSQDGMQQNQGMPSQQKGQNSSMMGR